MACVETVVKRLMNNKDFDYLVNQRAFACYDGKTVADRFNGAEEFIMNVCRTYPYFPAGVVSYNNGKPATEDEINSVVNYIVDLLFMLAHVDIFVDKFSKSPILGKNNFEGFTITDINDVELLRNYDGIHFAMQDTNRGMWILIRLVMPSFLTYDYKKFNTTVDFKQNTRAWFDVLIGDINLSNVHISVWTSSLLDAFPHFLLDQLHEFVTSNKL